jgi:hypothetical protein
MPDPYPLTQADPRSARTVIVAGPTAWTGTDRRTIRNTGLLNCARARSGSVDAATKPVGSRRRRLSGRGGAGCRVEAAPAVGSRRRRLSGRGGAGCRVEAAPAEIQAAAESSLAQYLHLMAPIGRSLERHHGHFLVGGGSPKTVDPRVFMYARYGTTRAK